MMYTVYDYRLLFPNSVKSEDPSDELFLGTDPYLYLKKPSPPENIYLVPPRDFLKKAPFLPLR